MVPITLSYVLAIKWLFPEIGKVADLTVPRHEREQYKIKLESSPVIGWENRTFM
jgi:hypothetical protein